MFLSEGAPNPTHDPGCAQVPSEALHPEAADPTFEGRAPQVSTALNEPTFRWHSV